MNPRLDELLARMRALEDEFERELKRRRAELNADFEDRRVRFEHEVVEQQRRFKAGLLGYIEPVMSCDTDLSQRVTREEYDTCIATRFAALDTDHDGLFQRSEAHLWRERRAADHEPH